MRSPWLSLAVAVSAFLALGCAQNSPERPNFTKSRKAVAETPTTGTERPSKPTPDEVAEIKSLIHRLREISDPDVGFSPTMTGTTFSPIPSSSDMINGILMNHGLKRSDALINLVKIGPKALPFLLDAIDNPTPTKITIEYGGGFGGMWYAERPAIRWAASENDNWSIPQTIREFNPKNLREKKILDQAKQEFQQINAKRTNDKRQAGSDDDVTIEFFEDQVHEHTMSVGDICYVIIGQITNRTYFAAQYQPTACVYINSPVQDKKLAEDVRSVWNADDPAETLFESLLIDFKTDNDWQGYRDGAAMRLDFYFPERSESLLLKHLEDIDLSTKDRDWLDGDVRLVQSLTASKSEKIRQRLTEIMSKTSDLELFLAALPGIEKSQVPLALKRSEEFIRRIKQQKEEKRASLSREVKAITSYDASRILEIIASRFPESAVDFFNEYLSKADFGEIYDLGHALERVNGPVVADTLARLLKDKRVLKDESPNPTRVCDFVARIISDEEEQLSFQANSSEQVRDEQIGRIWQHCTGIGIRREP